MLTRKNFLILIVELSVVMTSCMSFEQKTSVPKVRNTVKVVSDDFKPIVKVMGIEDYIGDKLEGTFFIRSFFNKKDKTVMHQVYVSCEYMLGWRTYNSAFLAGGEKD